MDYVSFDYGKRINSYRTPSEEMPNEYADPDYRLARYAQIVGECADRLAADPDVLRRMRVRKPPREAARIFAYILRLLPPQDLFELYEGEAPDGICLEAAAAYDPECWALAAALLERGV